jgi:NAD(P)-dependent dehydrogenase (short-subunit alcohol dehydrogenase family)
MKYGIIQMLKQGGGVIINTASVAGLIGFPNITAYCASKGGVVQLTKTAALEYATQNIRINCLCPGVIWTPMMERFTGGDEEAKKQFTAMEPVGRMGTPEEVAQAALFLVSDDASFVTGVPFPVDGGYVAQ